MPFHTRRRSGLIRCSQYRVWVAQGEADIAGIFYSKSVYPYTVQGGRSTCATRGKQVAGINTLTLVKNGPERKLAIAFINSMLDPGVSSCLPEATLTAPSIAGLDFKPEVAKYMAYPESKMDEMQFFSPDSVFINPLRPELLETSNRMMAREVRL